MKRFVIVASIVTLAVLAACGTSRDTIMKQAQSTGDKYFELLRAGDPSAAYDKTFSDRYKMQLPKDTYLKFQQGLDKMAGPIVAYQLGQAKYNENANEVLLTYALQTQNLQQPIQYSVKLASNGSDWQIVSVEPNVQPTAPPQQPAAPQSAPAPGGQSAPK